jgi:hypothetical protein
MGIDVVGYLETTGTDIKYSGDNVGPNDIAISCLWCDDPSYHLTIHRTKGYLNCWRCQFDEYKVRNKKGWGPSFKNLIKEIEGCSWSKAKEIWKDIGGDTAEGEEWNLVKEEQKKICEFPSGCYPFGDPGPFVGIRDYAYAYLKGRGFSRYHVEKYNLQFTAIGYYEHRIIIPIYNKEGKLANWLGRKFINSKEGRYKNCRLQDCTTRLAESIYGAEYFQGDVLRIVEGAFDKMRIGDSAVALNRSQFSRTQRNIVSKLARDKYYISVILDSEAISRAISIAEELSPFHPRIKVVQLPEGKDPASMTFPEIQKAESETAFMTF